MLSLLFPIGLPSCGGPLLIEFAQDPMGGYSEGLDLESRALDRITELAARLFGTPVAVIAIAEQDRVRFPSHFGLDVREIPRVGSLFDSAPASDGVTTAADADASVAGLRVRFYAGCPIAVEGQPVGTLAVLDTRRRPPLSEDEQATLSDLAVLAARELGRPAPDSVSGE